MTSNSSKCVIVTGANSGIGLAATKKIIAQGFDVVMACRDVAKAEKVLSAIKEKDPSADAKILKLDLSSFASVRDFVTSYKALKKDLYSLVNNAGLMMPQTETKREASGDGHEITMHANYLGHFLLTHLLVDDLKAGAEKFGEARVVNVSSTLHDIENSKSSLRGKKLPLEELRLENFDLEEEGTYNGVNAYMNSKAAQIMHAYSLAEKLKGTNVSVNSLCPGFVPATDISRYHDGFTRVFLKHMLGPILYMTGGKKGFVTLDVSGERVCDLATSPKYSNQTGNFYCYGELGESTGCTNDKKLQEELYQYSLKAVGVF